MARRVSRDRGKETYWRGRISAHAESGLTISGFCRREGISANSFFRWRRVLSERGHTRQPESGGPMPGPVPQGLFAPVSVSASSRTATADDSSIEVVIPSGHVLRVRPGFDPDTLARLLGLLESCRC